MNDLEISWRRVEFDICLLVILPCFGIYMDNYWVPPMPGYFVSDMSIQYAKKENTISPRTVTLVSGFLPLLIFLYYDLVIYKRKGSFIYHNIVTFMIGIDLVYVTNNLVKYNLGWPRPYFLQACVPDRRVERSAPREYVANAVCHGDSSDIKWASLSFPSLHASSTAYGMLYLFIFLCQRNKDLARDYVTNMCTAIIQCIAVTWTVFVAASRVGDNRHHVRDVIAGSAWGFVFCLIMVFRCSGMQIYPNNPQQQGVQASRMVCQVSPLLYNPDFNDLEK